VLSAWALAVTLTAGCGSSTAGTAEPTGPVSSRAPVSGNGLIVFAAFDSNDKTDLWSVAPDGSGLAQLTDTPDEREICPDVSPDGTQLAFCKSADGGFEIWTADIDGSNQRQLTDLGSGALFPDWSPQGDRIVFSLSQGPSGPSSLRLVDAASGEVTTLLEDDGPVEYPTFSPEGSTVLYTKSGQLWTIDVETGQSTQLTTDSTQKDPTPDWSPDGTRIAYHANSAGDDDIWIMNADGTDQRNLTAAARAAELGTAFSPDGQYIAFTGTGGPVPDGERYIQIMRTDGTERRVLVPTPGLAHAVPAWQPLPQPTP
jgi:TolB protein